MSPSATNGPFPSRPTTVNWGGPVEPERTIKSDAIGSLKGNENTKAAGVVYLHLEDLTHLSRPDDIDKNASIRRLISHAEAFAKRADTDFDFRRPDKAYEAHLKASIIASEFIPGNQEYPTLVADKSELNREYVGLLKRLRSQSEKVPIMQQAIRENNARNGVQSSLELHQNGQGKTVVSGRGNSHSRAQPITNGNATIDSDDIKRPKKAPPQVPPKRQALHGKTIFNSTPVGEKTSPVHQTELAARFAALRSSPTSPNLKQDPRIRTQSITGLESAVTTHQSPLSGLPSGRFPTTTRPPGPWEMPTTSPKLKEPRAKPTLDTQIPEMPRPPDAIYSPSLSSDPATTHLPSSAPRSLSYLGNSKFGSAPPVSKVARTPSISESKQDNYFSYGHTAPSSGYSQTIAKASMPKIAHNSETVTAGELVDYIKMGSQGFRTLLVDVRTRAEFDHGHILASSIICVEPITLQEHGLSADELEEKLVLSPDAEQDLYHQRDQYDLIVFYDQSSVSLVSPKSASQSGGTYLQNFVKAIYEFGYEKQSKLPPKLLYGGLEAWTDIMGASSLRSSNTSNLVTSAKNNRMLQPKTRSSQLENIRPIPKNDGSNRDAIVSESKGSSVAGEDSEEFSYARSTEEFLRNYPPVPESMTSKEVVPNYNNQIDIFSHPPARPPPALPRQRSSGVSEKGPSSAYTMLPGSGPGSITNPRFTPFATGLFNYGPSCYANAILQCLCATEVLRNFLLHWNHKSKPVPPRPKSFTEAPACRPSQDTWKDENMAQRMTLALKKTMHSMTSGSYENVAPNIFWGYLKVAHRMVSPPEESLLGGSQQQDVSELFGFIMDLMLDELNTARDQPDYQQKQLNDDESKWARSQQLLHQSSAEQWRLEKGSQQSEVADIFRGQRLRQHICPNDPKHIHRSWEPFNYLNIVLPSTNCSLGDVLAQNFIQKEEGDNEARLTCLPCKDKVAGFQTFVNISYMPDYLVLYMQRFAYSPTVGGVQRNNATVGGFDSDRIDLTPYSAHQGDLPAGDQTEDLRGMQRPYIYQAYAAIFHRGQTIGSGHYVSLVRHLDQTDKVRSWTLWNDCRTPEFNQRGPEYGDKDRGGRLVMLFLKRTKQR